MAMRFHFFKSNDFHDKVKGHVYWIPYKTEIAITRHAEPHICIKGNNPSFLVVLLSRNVLLCDKSTTKAIMSDTKQNIKDVIIEALLASDGGKGISNLEDDVSSAGLDVNRRTLQRILSEMEDDGEVSREGKSVAVLYFAHRAEKRIENEGLNLSDRAIRIQKAVAQPAIAKRPVTWNSSFLEDYIPNDSFFLDVDIRTQLHDMGRTGVGNSPAGTHLRDVLGRLMIDLSWASSKLEGNRYSRLETEELINLGKVAQGKDLEEAQMILNHKAAIEMIAESPEEIGFDRYTFMNLHALLSENLMKDPAASGRLRRRPVDITGSVFTPLAIPQRIEEAFDMILEKVSKIKDPFEASFFLMAQITYLQPFEDVNKRVSRLGANIPLIKANVSPLSFIEIPEAAYFQGTQAIYELNETRLLAEVYLAAYERSCQRYAAIVKSMPEPDPLRLQYRNEIKSMVRDTVLGAFTGLDEYVDAESLVSNGDKLREIIDEEVDALHEGNLMRYGLRRSQFEAWISNAQDTPDGP